METKSLKEKGGEKKAGEGEDGEFSFANTEFEVP